VCCAHLPDNNRKGDFAAALIVRWAPISSLAPIFGVREMGLAAYIRTQPGITLVQAQAPAAGPSL
jgi:hypothetical protein